MRSMQGANETKNERDHNDFDQTSTRFGDNQKPKCGQLVGICYGEGRVMNGSK
jgi:hypothetical protein